MHDSKYDGNSKDGDWIEYRRLVMTELRRVSEALESESDKFHQKLDEAERMLLDKLEDLKSSVEHTKREVVALQVKAASWGSLGGAFFAVVIEYVRS